MTSLANQHLERHQAQAAKAFAWCHVVTKQSEGRWLLQQLHEDGVPDWTMAAEIIVLAGRDIYVGGDVDHVIFGHGPADPMGRLRWIGECTDLGYYVAQKARIGMGGRPNNDVDIWDGAIAAEQLVEFLTEQEAQGDLKHIFTDRNDSPDGADDIQEFVDDNMPTEDRHAFQHWVWCTFDADTASECIIEMGEILAPRVIYGHAAIARLCQLLRAAEKTAPVQSEVVAHG